ncbi:MAG: CDP-alcohol phosphatidyltransferase family protein [Methanobrevibacter sp.]|jgi:archaetidylinositol phosphate synthase|nr:CDP-alcohol phosphatidyltransferase family protein [Methanobrevibacter sp.]
MLNRFRPFLKNILEPIAKNSNINPNLISLLSFLIAILSAVFIGYYNNLELGSLFILLSGFFDVLDGAIARYHNKTSKFGAILDSSLDRFSDAIIIMGFIHGLYIDWFLGILAIHSGFMVSYVRASSQSQGISNDVGVAERAVRLIILIISLVVGLFLNVDYIQFIIMFLVVISYFTVIQRLFHSYKHEK